MLEAQVRSRSADVFSGRGKRSSVSPESDEALYLSFRDRTDERALDGLVARHWARSYRLALGLVRDPGAAEDVAQEAFVQVVVAARAGKELDPFGGWLTCVVLNGARKALRSTKRRAQHEDVARAARPEETTVTPSSLEDYAALLPDEIAAPVLLHYGLGLTQVETAAMLGCPTGTVASRLRSGLEKLRASLGASVAVEACFAEGWLPVRESAVPSAPRGADLLARASSLPTPGSAPRALSGTVAATALASLVVLAVSGLAFATLSRGPQDVAGLPRSALAPTASTIGSRLAPDEGSPRDPVAAPPIAGAASTLAPTTGATATGESAGAALAALDADDLGEPDSHAPAYPWHEYSLEDRARIAENERLLEERTVSVEFRDTPLPEVAAWWNEIAPELGVPRVTLDPHIDPAFMKTATVWLRVADCSAKSALNLILSSHYQLVYEVGPGEIRVTTSDLSTESDDAVPRDLQIPLLAHKRPQPFVEISPEEKARQDEANRKYMNVRSAVVDFNFTQTPLLEATDELEKQTGVAFTVSKTIDADEIRLSGIGRQVPLGEALATLLKEVGLAYRLKNESVFICPKEDPPAPERQPDQGLWIKPAGLELRGVTLRDVIAALERLGVTTVVSPEAWRSNGTLSIAAAPGATVKVVLELMRHDLGLRLSAVEAEEEAGTTTRIQVIVREQIPSAREALLAPIPRFPGVARQVRELRAALASSLRARHAARASSETPAAKLVAAEAATHRLTGRLLDLVHRSGALEAARERRAALPSPESIRADLARARRRLEVVGPDATATERCAVTGLEARRDELEHDVAEADAAVALLGRLEKGEPLPPPKTDDE